MLLSSSYTKSRTFQPLSAKMLGVHKKLWRDRTRTADSKWLKRYSVTQGTTLNWRGVNCGLPFLGDCMGSDQLVVSNWVVCHLLCIFFLLLLFFVWLLLFTFFFFPYLIYLSLSWPPGSCTFIFFSFLTHLTARSGEWASSCMVICCLLG